jgi:predicted AAA+ superfamily ATPase
LAKRVRSPNKRIVKTPKIYFYDTGLLCYLLKIKTVDQLNTYPLRGQIFENFIISEAHKAAFNQGQEPSFYFWRDQKGLEVDLIVEDGDRLFPIEIKSGTAIRPEFLKNIEAFNRLRGAEGGRCIYAGDEEYTLHGIEVVSWRKRGPEHLFI